eukprot:TRINITY_DN664_c0_g1_i1.p1 TRINITY_DN664_c0_g1~~TRINITY_DN664_c0_g1_i1.p1  ORF type:complete len:223 (+),score=22.99 TRINITY_DN664_c0_g1_i1:242-910(+)
MSTITRLGKPIKTLDGLKEPSCAWFPDSKKFILSSMDREISIHNLQGIELETIGGAGDRVFHIALSKDGSRLVCTTTEYSILIFDMRRTTHFVEIKHDKRITSFSLSNDPHGRFALLNVAGKPPTSSAQRVNVEGEIHLWDLDRERLVRKYVGHKQSRFIVRSAFGGVGPAPCTYVVSGSEDCQIYIWRRADGALCEIISGHSGVVTDVSWNPKIHMFCNRQ